MFFGHNLARGSNYTLLSDGNAAASGTTYTSSALNMNGDQGVQVTLVLGTVASGGGGVFKLQGSNDNGVSDPFVDLANTGQTFSSTNSGHMFVTDIYRPQKGYIQAVCVLNGGGNTTIQSIVAQTYHLAVAPEGPPTGTDGIVWLSNVAPGAA